MNALRARLRELPPPERFWATATTLAAAAILGWLVGGWVGALAGGGFAAQLLLGKPSRKPRQEPPRDRDAERLEQDLQRQRDRAFELFRPGETRPLPPPVEEETADHGDAYYLEKDMEHRRREAARLLQPKQGAPPPRPAAPSRPSVALFPPDPRPRTPAPRGAELFKEAPPAPRPIVEECSRLFRRARRSGNIVE